MKDFHIAHERRPAGQIVRLTGSLDMYSFPRLETQLNTLLQQGHYATVGANLMQLLMLAQEGEWDEVGGVIKSFQQMTAAIKFCPRPVVVAPFGLALGGGAEICLHAARRQAHAETYIGLVEAGVGSDPCRGRDERDAAAGRGCRCGAGPARSA